MHVTDVLNAWRHNNGLTKGGIMGKTDDTFKFKLILCDSIVGKGERERGLFSQ